MKRQHHPFLFSIARIMKRFGNGFHKHLRSAGKFYTKHRKILVGTKIILILVFAILSFTVWNHNIKVGPTYAGDTLIADRCVVYPGGCENFPRETCESDYGNMGCSLVGSISTGGGFTCEEIPSPDTCIAAECIRDDASKTCKSYNGLKTPIRCNQIYNQNQLLVLTDAGYCKKVDLGGKLACRGKIKTDNIDIFNKDTCSDPNFIKMFEQWGYKLTWVNGLGVPNTPDMILECLVKLDVVQPPLRNKFFIELGKEIPANNHIKRYAIQQGPESTSETIRKEYNVGDPDDAFPDTRNSWADFSDHNFKILECDNGGGGGGGVDPLEAVNNVLSCTVGTDVVQGPLGNSYFAEIGKMIPANNHILRYAIQRSNGNWTEYNLGDADESYPEIRNSWAYFSDHNFKLLYCDNIVNPAVCGNSVVEGTESCDNGNANSDNYGSTCNSACHGPASYCGDGIVDVNYGEACDEGLAVKGKAGHCDANCQGQTAPAFCGDGYINAPEVCDNGIKNGTTPGGCNTTCDGYMPVCGNGIVEPSNNEMCDRGSNSSCRKDCTGLKSASEQMEEDLARCQLQ